MKKFLHLAFVYFSLTAAGVINAFGITFFLYPVHLYDSGVSGTSMLLAQITPDGFSLSLFLLLLNFPLFLYGYKKMGWSFTLRSVYAVGIYSLASWLITDVFPVDVRSALLPLLPSRISFCARFSAV